MKYFIYGATFVASFSLVAMKPKERSLLMAHVVLTPDAEEILEASRCTPDVVCSFCRDDERLDIALRNKVTQLRCVVRKNFNGTKLELNDFESMSGDADLCIAWLALLSGKKRDLVLQQLTGYLIECKHGQQQLQFLEWHGFKANRLPSNILKEIEEYAQRSPAHISKKYLLSLKNPREYSCEDEQFIYA